MTRRGWGAAAALALLGAAACGPADDVKVQPLPPKQRPTAEARAGLPEVRGTWRFAGWEISPADTGRVAADPTLLAPPGEFFLSLQRLDSLAGGYGRGAPQYPLVGEVRRDGVVSLVAFETPELPRFAAGRVVRDTLWLESTSFPSAATWPAGTRAGFVRTAVRAPFLRLLGGVPRVNYDSLRADSIRRDSLSRLVQDSFAARYPQGAAPQPAAGAPPAAAPPAARPVPPAGGQPPRPQPQPAQPQPSQPTLPRPLTPPAQQPPVRRPDSVRITPRPTPARPDTPRRPPPVQTRPVEPAEPPPQPTITPPPAPRETIRINP